ncbi:hypothetical protein C798_25385 [Herbaspirillum rubrisubalbicans Os34]|uniref:Uncharacterized protein n=1 Tax=Herbaspirillum rubrisubalbicans Os34 TaxID=1235827 RepID=A0A6M3ZXW2_9BURK|nr:hypothetical protein [Herbaspirillum rubrisubalbicans]QJQ03448.1 hypothetical protein C798_25385 [Herbaspirillum rubrisubalbicans Os34]
MANDEPTKVKDESLLPLILEDVKPNFEKAKRRDKLISDEKYDAVEKAALAGSKIGTNGVTYVKASAFGKLFNVSDGKGRYIFENQIPATDKISDGGKDYAHSSSVVGLLDKKGQEVRGAQNQAMHQFSRDTILNISDSPQAQDLRRMCDDFTRKAMPKLKGLRGASHDEVTKEPLGKGAAFHHTNPKELHTDPQNALNPSKGVVLNQSTHIDVHKNNLHDVKSFDEYVAKKNKEKDD